MENEDEYEYGDLEAASDNAGTFDCSFQQFMTRPVILRAGDDDSDMEKENEHPPPRMPTPPVAASNSS